MSNNNKLVISNECSLNGVRMSLQGDNNEIILGKGVHINASQFNQQKLMPVMGLKL